MTLADMITEIGYEVDRTGIDNQIKIRLQQAIGIAYTALPKEERQRTATLTTVSSQRWLNVPGDFGDVVSIYDSNEDELPRVTPGEFFAPGKLKSSGTPLNYIYWNGQILFSPVPDDAYAYTLHYHMEKPNIYVHDLTIKHYAYAQTGAKVYVDEDAIATGEGRLIANTSAATDYILWLEDADCHKHTITIYHDANAATNGIAWYYAEGETNAWERGFFASPTQQDTVVRTSDTRLHNHFLKFIHNPSISDGFPSTGKNVYLDENYTDPTKMLNYISPTTADHAFDTIDSKECGMAGFLERYHSVIFDLAVARMHRFNKNYDAARTYAEAAANTMALFTGKPNNIVKEVSRQE